MIPEFLEPFKENLRAYEREFIEIKATAIGKKFHSDSLGVRKK